MISKIKGEITSRIGKVIFNFNLIENSLNQIITSFFNISNEKEEFFKHNLLNSSLINFNSKIKLLKQILENIEFENIKTTIKLLEDLNRYRNMFAHCRIEFEEVFSSELVTKNNNRDLSNIYMDISYIKPTLKNSMNAQGKISDKEFFKYYEEFKEKTLEVEKKLHEIKNII